MIETTQPSERPRTAQVYQLEHYRFTHSLPPAIRSKLKEIFANRAHFEQAESSVQALLAQVPDSLGVRMVAYRFYFHHRRSQEAAYWAQSCMDWLAEQLKIPKDWRIVSADMADFRNWHTYTRLWLQSLVAYAYNMARLQKTTEALHALDKIQALDPQDRVGARHLRQVFTQAKGDADMLLPNAYEPWCFHPQQIEIPSAK